MQARRKYQRRKKINKCIKPAKSGFFYVHRFPLLHTTRILGAGFATLFIATGADSTGVCVVSCVGSGNAGMGGWGSGVGANKPD